MPPIWLGSRGWLALRFLRAVRADRVNSTYAVALQTMAFAAAGDPADRPRIAENAGWLVSAQIQPGDRRCLQYRQERGIGFTATAPRAMLRP